MNNEESLSFDLIVGLAMKLEITPEELARMAYEDDIKKAREKTVYVGKMAVAAARIKGSRIADMLDEIVNKLSEKE